MNKNFLTAGIVMALAWISLAPLSLLFVVTIASSPYAIRIKIASLLATLFSWIFLSVGTGFLWRKESQRQLPEFSPMRIPKVAQEEHPKTTSLPLEDLQTMTETAFSGLCARLFKKLWPEMVVDGSVGNTMSPERWTFRLHQKRYFVYCQNRRTFFDSRDIQRFRQLLEEKEAVHGYFFTTGIFSTSAQEAAASSNIELIDGQKTVELLGSFLEEKALPPSHPPPIERRAHPRFAFDRCLPEERLSIDLGNIYQRSLKTTATLLDVSLGGACIASSSEEEFPSFFQLRLALPGRREPLHILGEVAWRKTEPSGQTKRYGISFASMTDENREKLNHFLKRHADKTYAKNHSP